MTIRFYSLLMLMDLMSFTLGCILIKIRMTGCVKLVVHFEAYDETEAY